MPYRRYHQTKERKKKMKKTMSGFRKGATFIEYALLAGLVAIVVATTAMLFGDKLKDLFSSTGDQTEKVTTEVKKVDLTKGFQGGGTSSKPTK